MIFDILFILTSGTVHCLVQHLPVPLPAVGGDGAEAARPPSHTGQALHNADRPGPGSASPARPPEARHHPAQIHDDFPATGPMPVPQNSGHQFPTEPFIQMEWLVAPVSVVPVEQGQLLVPIHGTVGVVKIQNDGRRR